MKKRTIVYIDGFNLYYGCLKSSSYKWLDLKKLFSKLLGDEHDIIKIKYFTTNILKRGNNEASRIRQRKYLNAIKNHIPELEIHYGYFLSSVITAKHANPPPTFVPIHKTEEKGTDVNIGLEIINDAWTEKYDCAVLVSNDSDLSRALELIKKNHQKTVGVIAPILFAEGKDGKKLLGKNLAPVSKNLTQYADFVYRYIRPSVLSDSQLPDEVPNKAFKPYQKPKEWN